MDPIYCTKFNFSSKYVLYFFGIRQENHVHDDDEEQENIYQN